MKRSGSRVSPQRFSARRRIKARVINVAELFFVLRINILEISNENGVVGARRVS